MASNEVVQGLQDLLDSMERLKYSYQRKLIAGALRKGAKLIADLAKRLAPNDPATAGNRIADNIAVSVVDQSATGARAQIGPTRKGFMGIFAEKGTVKQKATPFLEPAFDQKIEDAWRAISTEIADGIESEFAKTGGVARSAFRSPTK